MMRNPWLFAIGLLAVLVVGQVAIWILHPNDDPEGYLTVCLVIGIIGPLVIWLIRRDRRPEERSS